MKSIHTKHFGGTLPVVLFLSSLIFSAWGDDLARGAGARLAEYQVPAGAEAKVLRVAYFVPADREAPPGYAMRVERILTDIQAFYRNGMRETGFGERTFPLDRDREGRVKIYFVQGQRPLESYPNERGQDVRDEVGAVLLADGVDIEEETLLIFQLLLQENGQRYDGTPPYYGGRQERNGTAWVYDFADLDPLNLPRTEPTVYYRDKPYSLGQMNSLQIGGVAHELGHALGLPHLREKPDEAMRGRALMGSGNYTYREELRDEGPGTFLSRESALRLASHPLFSGSTKDLASKDECSLTDLQVAYRDRCLELTGTVQTVPPPYAVVAYTDPPDVDKETEADYDSYAWPALVDQDGRFRIAMEDLEPVHYDLRLAVCLLNGGAETYFFDFDVLNDNEAQVDSILRTWGFGQALRDWEAGDYEEAEQRLRSLTEQWPEDAVLRSNAEHLLQSANEVPGPAPSAVDVAVTNAALSRLTWDASEVGWLEPLRDRAPFEEGHTSILLQVGDRVCERGLYAHAPARHTYRLDKKWERLSSWCGLQAGHEGSVIFVVLGDGTELYRSGLITNNVPVALEVDVSGVDLLSLVVEDGGDNNQGDWGVWLAPRLAR